MARLGRVIVEAIAHEYGRDEVLRRLSHPFWFQSFGAVMGMDWHSSGITTSVVGALKRGLEPVANELGLHVCGGRGRQSRRTPDELHAVGEQTGLDAARLASTSRLVAKVDSAAVQDGFELYLHAFVVADDGRWVVIQQGMNDELRQARRYHWLSEGLTDFIDEPHSAIDGHAGGTILNLTDRRAARSREAQLDWVQRGPDAVLAALRQVRPASQTQPFTLPLPRLQMPAHHDVRAENVVMRRLHAALRTATEAGPRDFAALLATPGVGARTVETLALVAEVMHGAPARFSDPARFSLALGGKDGHPFPVPLHVYDRTIQVLRQAVDRARLGNDDRLAAVRRLDRQARWLESGASGPPFEARVAEERRRSREYGSRSVADDVRAAPKRPRTDPGQLSLF
jgi:hypothetical protein